MRAFDAVHDAQHAYRCLLQATASPGKLFGLPSAGAALAAEVALLALLDGEVSFSAFGPGARGAEERIVRETGARAARIPEADFVLILGGDSSGLLGDLKRGTLEAPEGGATAVYAVESLSGGPLTLGLSGPGVLGRRTLRVEGLRHKEAEEIRASRASYPLGVDVYLVDDAGLVAGLPRSTSLEVIG